MRIGGDGGGDLVIALPVDEKITGIEFGHPIKSSYWPAGTLCALKIYSNLNVYGPFSPRSEYGGCQEISTFDIPDSLPFSQFFKKYARKLSSKNSNGFVLTFDKDAIKNDQGNVK